MVNLFLIGVGLAVTAGAAWVAIRIMDALLKRNDDDDADDLKFS